MDMIYNASAGTGKTWQVTELYSALVLGSDHEQLSENRPPVDPRRILLMTFTDNAAAELRQRVAERMLAAQDENDLARRVLRTLPAANISTIHAFCAGLLREHALEIGLSPSFQTLEDEERDALLDDTLKAELFQTLENDPDFRDFCSGLSILHGDYSLLSTIRSLLEKAASRGLDLSDAENLLSDVSDLSDPSDPHTQRICALSLELREILDARSSIPKTLEPVFQWLENWEPKFPNLGNLDEFATSLDDFGKFGRVKGCKEISTAFDTAKEEWKTAFFYQQNIGKFRAFARCLARCETAFTQAKRARDAVDFGDQLLLTRDLLNGGGFKNLFDWIIVDEVQDTSRVQCDLIEALWGKQTNLVVCGDRKQSIYAWRSADPNVMPDLEAAMEARGDCKKIDLKTSYRSKERVLEAVNELFEGIYDSYDALEPLTSQPDEKPCVEFLEADDEEQGSEEEMAAVARRIRLLVDGGEEWRPKFGHDGSAFVEGEPFGYGDILILLKRSTHQSILEKALRTAGIPYTSGGKGCGLFEKQEVRDLLLFLQVITQPQNDLALVGFLRSPFANLPDEEIIQLGWDGETFDHEILRKQFFEGDSEPAERILRFRAMVGKKSPSQLVREIVRETGFDAYWAGQPAGEQHLANFKKAVDWLRKAERGGQVLIGDVVRQFEKYIQAPPRSGAAEALLPDPEQNAVTLMTVHGAKGLTQRVCFVPDISFGDTSESGFAMLSPEGLLEMSLSGLAGEKIKSPGWVSAREADKAVRKLEQDNVFYVAMTRARDLVVLSGTGTKKPNGWLKQAESFLQNASSDLLRTIPFSNVPSIGKPEVGGRDQETGVRFLPLNIPDGLVRKPVMSLVRGADIPVCEMGRQDCLPPTGDRRAYGTLGHLVLEELAKNNWNGDIPVLVEKAGGACRVVGRASLYSESLCSLRAQEDTRSRIREACPTKDVKPLALDSILVETERLIEQLESARVALQKETAGAVALFAEHPFVLKRGDTILDGTIDLLAKFSNHWKIFDYKFSNESPDAAFKTYSPQLLAYREAVEKLHPGAEVSAALVLIGENARVKILQV